MTFCGQCGLPLAPGSKTCPRCGAVTEADLSPVEELHVNDPTLVSLQQPEPYTPQLNPNIQRPGSISSPTPPQQQKLILRPGGSDPGFAASDPNEPTKMMASPAQRPSNLNAPTSYADFPPTQYADPQPVPTPFGGTPLPTQSPRRKGRGRFTVLTIILVVLLLMAGMMAVFVARPTLLKGLLGNNPTPTSTTAVDQARSVIQRYYDDINNQNYRDAYDLWIKDSHTQSFDDFAAGYAHTGHDDLTITEVKPISSDTVQVSVMLVATEETASGTTQTTYKGSYIVKQVQGEWKIKTGTLDKVA